MPVDVRKECYKIAGLLGIDCKGFSMRELVWMCEGKFPDVKEPQPVGDNNASLRDQCVLLSGEVSE